MARSGRFLVYWLVVAVVAALVVFDATPAQAIPPHAFFVASSSTVTENATTHNQVVVELDITGVDPTTIPVTVTVEVNGELTTATAGADYNFTATDVTFPVGTNGTNNTLQIPVQILEDTAVEGNETIVLSITAADPDRVGPASTHTITIVDDELTIGDAQATEGVNPTISFPVTLSAVSSQTVTVAWATSPGTAIAGQDYATNSGTVTFVPGDTAETVTVTINDNGANETTETFTVNLSSPTNATIADGTATGTIFDNDAVPTVSIGDADVTEGPGVIASFDVSLSAISGQTVTVPYTLAGVTATPTADFSATPGTLVFAPGVMTLPIGVPIVNDALDEMFEETFTVNLGTPTNAVIADGSGTGTIEDEDPFPVVNIGSAFATEGSSIIFPVTLSTPSGRVATVSWSTATDSAFGSDFTMSSGTLTFVAGDTAETITVPTTPDTIDEINETFTVTLVVTGTANPFLNLGTATATGTINDDDGEPGISINDATANETDGVIVFNVNLLPEATGATVTVDWVAGDGTATAGSDYSPSGGTVTFTSGVTLQQISVPLLDDAVDEGPQTVTVTLSDATAGFAIVDGTAIGTITDDDNAAPAVTLRTLGPLGNQKALFKPNEMVTLSATILDGIGDTHSATVNWGDGSPEETWALTAGSTSFTRDHAFAQIGAYTISAQVADAEGGVQTQTRQILVSNVAPDPETVGLVNPLNGGWHLRDLAGNVSSFFFGNPGDYGFSGDWNCDGVVTPGMYRQSDGYVYLRNTNTQGIADIRFFFGNPGDIPLPGDFDGDGCDTVSIYRPSSGQIFIMNELGENDGGLGAADYSYFFGNPGDKPFVGDFDGNGIDTVGLHRESTGLVYFRLSNTQGVADNQFIFGDPGDRLVAGDWNGNGIDTVAVYRPSNQTFYFRFTNTQGTADTTLQWGAEPWTPVAGAFS